MTTSARGDDREEHRSADADAMASSIAAARRALDYWRWAMRGMPVMETSEESRTALRSLVAWYERVAVDDSYNNPAPADGLDALAAQEHGPNRFRDRVQVAHWAVRVAQELAECRRTHLDDGDSVLAYAKLDLALRGAFDRLR